MADKILSGEIGTDITIQSLTGGRYILNSFGGSLIEGLSMYDMLVANDNEMGVIGICASAATLPLLACSNRWGTPNSKYLIHNPAAGIEGDALALAKAAIELKDFENQTIDIYSKHLSISKEEIAEMMNKDSLLTAQQALEIGLINEIKDYRVTPEMKSLILKSNIKMEKQKDIMKFEGLIKEIKNLFFKDVKMVMIAAADGTQLEFSVENVEEVIVGVTATVDGSPAEGEYLMPDGRVFVFAAGELTAINEPQADETEALKAEIETLKAQLLEKDTVIEASLKSLKSIEAEFNGFKMKFSASKPIINTPAPVGEPVKVTNKYKGGK